MWVDGGEAPALVFLCGVDMLWVGDELITCGELGNFDLLPVDVANIHCIWWEVVEVAHNLRDGGDFGDEGGGGVIICIQWHRLGGEECTRGAILTIIDDLQLVMGIARLPTGCGVGEGSGGVGVGICCLSVEGEQWQDVGR